MQGSKGDVPLIEQFSKNGRQNLKFFRKKIFFYFFCKTFGN